MWHAISNYETFYKTIPDAANRDRSGQPLSSWRFPTSIYIAQPAAKCSLSEAWDSPANKKLAELSGRNWFASLAPAGDPQLASCTQMMAITGRDTAFEAGRSTTLSSLPKDLAIILLSNGGRKVHWMEPGDWDVEKLLACRGRLGDCAPSPISDRVFVVFADGEIWALSPETPMAAFSKHLTITSARTSDRERTLSPYRIE